MNKRRYLCANRLCILVPPRDQALESLEEGEEEGKEGPSEDAGGEGDVEAPSSMATVRSHWSLDVIPGGPGFVVLVEV
jgi:hypothetical protein